jgi:repressor LexA
MNCLKQIRESKNLSQSQLAEMTGIKVPNISAYENGRLRMREDTIRRFAEALGVRPGEILGDKK